MKQFLILFFITPFLIFATSISFQHPQKGSDYKVKVKSVVRSLYRDPVVTYGANAVVTDIQPDGDPFAVIAEYFNEDHQLDSIVARRYLINGVDVHKTVYRYQQGKVSSWETFSNHQKSGSGTTTWQTDKKYTVKEFDTLHKLHVVSKHDMTDSFGLYKKTDNKRYDKSGKLLSHYIEEFRFDTAHIILSSTLAQPPMDTTTTYYQCMQKDIFGNPVKMIESTDNKKILCLYAYSYYR
jgi:hypothetical protein